MDERLHEFPYTTYAENPCSCFMNMCCRAGIKLAVVGDSLQLLDRHNFVLSSVKINQATIALQDELGHDLTGYVYNLIVRDNKLIAIGGNGNEIALTIPYATEAGSTAEATHAISSDSATRATLSTTATEATHSSTSDYATMAGSATTSGSAAEATHATTADTANIATTATTAQTAVKAQQDASGNQLTATYVANIVLNSTTGAIEFYAKNGSLISSIIPITNDPSGDPISDYVKSVVYDAQSNYLQIIHGDGTTDTIIIQYSTHAWKDTAENIIKNVYFKTVDIIYDSQTNEPWLVFYNGEGSEVARIQVVAQSAAHADTADHATTADSSTTADTADYATEAGSATDDADGDDIRETYGHSLGVSGIINIALIAKDGTILSTLEVPYADRALKDNSGANIRSTYGHSLYVNNQENKIGIADANGVSLNEITVGYASTANNSNHATTADSATTATRATSADSAYNATYAQEAQSADWAQDSDMAQMAYADASGDEIETNYGHSLSISGDQLSLNDKNGTALSTITIGASPSIERTITIPYQSINTTTHLVTVACSGVTANSIQDVLPLLATSAANISNNEYLLDMGLYDAGQAANSLTFYVTNIPVQDVQVRVIIRGGTY